MAAPGNAVVEHSTDNPKIEGSNLALREKMVKNPLKSIKPYCLSISAESNVCE